MYGRRSLLYGSDGLLYPIKAVAHSRDVLFHLAKNDRDFLLPAHQLLQGVVTSSITSQPWSPPLG